MKPVNSWLFIQLFIFVILGINFTLLTRFSLIGYSFYTRYLYIYYFQANHKTAKGGDFNCLQLLILLYK